MISREEVLNLAQLARLQLSDEEVASLQKDISSILDYVGQVSNVAPKGDTSLREESPFGSTSQVRNVMREDSPRGNEDVLAGKEEALRVAFPKREGNFNVVRKIIQKDE